MRNDRIATPLLAAYLLAVFGVTQMSLSYKEGGLNLVPFAMMAKDLKYGGSGFLLNFLGNLALLAPLGFLLPVVRPAWDSAARVTLAGAGVSLLIESLQFASGRRVADVDDVLLNAASALLGYLAFAAIRRLSRAPTSPTYRAAVTPSRAHIEARRHVEHLGRAAVQTDLPNGTSRSLISTQ